MDFALDPAAARPIWAELDRLHRRGDQAATRRKTITSGFFDHRREHARTDWDNHGLPRAEVGGRCWARRGKLADTAGHYRYAWPKEMGGQGGTNLAMAVIREHLAAKGLGLFNDLQNEHSIVGNNPFVLMFKRIRHA